MLRVGFTGTQRGMTRSQRFLIYNLLTSHYGEFHHGDCIGSDAQAHDLAAEVGFQVIIHPPENPAKRAWKKSRQILPPRPYLDRNHDIVDSSAILLATPGEMHQEQRSGTWATIRYARKSNKKTIILFPDGTMTDQDGTLLEKYGTLSH